VGGSGETADLGVAPLRSIAVRMVAQERKVDLVIDGGTLAELGSDDRFLLASLADIPGVTVLSVAALPMAGTANILAEVVHGDLSTAWAAADKGAITSNASWGKPKAPLISGRYSPQPLVSATIAAASLRPEPVMVGDIEIEVLAQLDGPVKGFGERLWKKVMADHLPTQRLLAGETSSLKRVTYTDRYLFTPLTVALVKEILLGLRSVLPSTAWALPSVEVFTADSREESRRGAGQRIFSDWPDLGMRDRVLRSLLSHVGIDAAINSKDRKQLQHGRLFEATFESGEILSLRLDQGVGYWRVPTAGFVNYRATEFEFSRPGMDERRLLAQQVQRLAALAVPVEGSAQPTQIFVKVRDTAKIR
jgi:DEAD/DEAH box helicase domain-containing protein